MSEERSKKLAYILRHKPESVGVTLDVEGWCGVLELCHRTDFTVEELLEIVKNDEKQRYTMEGWPWKIRANQGHSTPSVNLTFKKATPPLVLWHGTSAKHEQTILKEGLKPMRRHHVHLSADLETAEMVAARRKDISIIFSVDTGRMRSHGIPFYHSDNGVWLVDYVDPKYLSRK